MKAWAVVRNNEPLECIEVTTPQPTGTQVVLAVEACGVCHSDLHFWKGSYNLGGGKTMTLTDRGVTLPRAPGHEVVGRVIATGPDASGVTIDESYIVYPWIGCGDCENCLNEDDNLCTAQKSIGVMQHGGFAGEVVAPHPRYLVPVGGLDPALASTFACSGITVYSAIQKVMPIAPDKPIVLIGAGGLGLAAIAMLRAFGHRAIVSVDLDPAKRQAALDMGATAAVDGGGEGAAQAIIDAAGGPVRAVIDFVNATSTAAAGFGALAKGGRLVNVGVAGGELTLSLAGMVFRAVSVVGSNTGSVKDLRAVVELAKSGKLPAMPVTRFPKDQANDVLQKLRHGEITGRAVLVEA
ncbi:alcohol dehydrogenase [Bosea sp. TND4EK4]|uniref:alcohol dehydrogenase n=1 Tax=Bosea sp. TND4EK4 TaxID=1907408 RepID=UPI000956928C|nr:alcohol dehydrogenase [Bosea sp. TND4EK4]SIR08782.1 alcohol dehydrogenase/alcohol dehydrogenase, propanol-preferring [Bosea sp. TND4EK4]